MIVRYGYIYMIKKNVSIQITSNHDEIAISDELSPDDVEEIAESRSGELEMTTTGTLKVADGRLVLSYLESELTGMNGSRTSVSFDYKNPGVVSMIRTGSVSTVLIFEEGKRNICAYNTELMAFEICINTFKVTNNLSLDGGDIDIKYTVEFRGATTEHAHVHLKVTPIPNNDIISKHSVHDFPDTSKIVSSGHNFSSCGSRNCDFSHIVSSQGKREGWKCR